ncbi:hypothetical protein E0H26_21210 [Micromonospora zingiberis]|uniref:Restriction endonuclease type IV Mrr domain-containing protein n=1 Tax=Micromonospora zingiberis TaxID=2053011 RepID=A0A4R0GBH0_9ACTN|nr:restriction endonuclease [Micromonospora zingiberis]TCB94444.1 hypothetical protein E0H26_21210 [Micromonospora zingiberis]
MQGLEMGKRNRDAGDEDHRPAAKWLSSDKHSKLLPTPWLNPYEFEEFVERLLRAERYLGVGVRHVARVERWGTSGDKQDGIDLAGEYSDGVPAAWQCKHLDRLRSFEVKQAVEKVTYEGAEEFYLVFSRVASSQARAQMRKYAGWTLLDRGQLTAMLKDLPAQVQRNILDQTWGEDVRRMFLEAPGDAFVSLETFVSGRRNPTAVMNDLGPLVGRTDELTALGAAFDRDSGGFRQVVVVSAPAGRGKSRLVAEALTALQERWPGFPVVCLAAGHRFHAAAMTELRMGPMVILIDDAHTDPAALAPLLAFVRERADVQLVLATRPSAKTGVVEQVALAQFGPSELAVVDVGQLAPKQARQLVKALTEGMRLRFPLTSYLAKQAEHSPFVAVITVNLIRRGELTASLGVDAALRTQILTRYQELLGTDVQGFRPETTQRVLATYTALGPVQTQDRALMDKIAGFCALKPIELARLLKALRDRGVLVEHGDVLRVVPDVLADHVLEVTAAFEDYDSGFVTELWDTFGTDHHHQLALSLGELDWRLAQRGGPRLMPNIWTAIRTRLQTPHNGRLVDELSQLEQLAATHPAEVVTILDEVRARLDWEDAEGVEPPEDEEEHPYRKPLGLAPLGRDDVRAKMPGLYARAAANDADQLETVLDALWALRRRDARPANSNPDHPERMVTDRLANLATLPHASFSKRIVARVTEWLKESGDAQDAATPLFALKPLLAKEELETVQASIRTLALQPHTFNAAKVRDVRNQTRELLQEQALSNDLRRAGEALDLLHEALLQPHGYFNQVVGDDTVLQWEDDDLATLQAFGHVSDKTTVPAVRRRVRDHIEWSADHATSLRIRHAALTLLARLDNAAGLADDVADQVWKNQLGLAAAKRRVVPTMEELMAERTAERERLAGLTEEERQADKNTRIHDKVQERMALRREQLADVARRLLDLGNIPAMLDLLDQTARAVLTLDNGRSITLWGLWRSIAEQSPEHLETIVRDINERPPGPLDQELNLLITRWLDHARDDATAWIQDKIVDGRREVKMAIANGFMGQRWHLLGEPLFEVWATGINDPDLDIAQAYLAAAGTYLGEQPIAAVKVLLEHAVSQFGAIRAIEDACHYDGRTYGAALNSDDATAILRLISHAGYDSHAVQEALTGIATAHPRLVLDHLADQADNGVPLPDDIHELNSAFDTHADGLAAWIHDNLSAPYAGLVIAAAVNDRLTNNQGTALARLAAKLDGDQLRSLVELLADIDMWALDQPDLAHDITARARERGVHERTRPFVQDAMQPHNWSAMNGISEELGSALALARDAAEHTTDLDLKADYEEAHTYLQALIDNLRRDNDDEDDVW